MLNFYHINVNTLVKGVEISSWCSTCCMDNEPKDEKVQVTWDNLNDIRQKFGLALPFNIWNYQKGRVISFFNASLFNRKTWDIKEWKESDLDLCLQVTYIKAHPCIDDILKWHNQEQAIQYLKERGIVY